MTDIKPAGRLFWNILRNLKYILVDIYTLAFMEQLGNKNF